MATVEAAAEHSFEGVQLFLNEGHLTGMHDLSEISECAFRAGLDIIVHLPNKYAAGLSPALHRLLEYQSEGRAVIHFLLDRNVPELAEVELGIENAVAGYDESYYRQLFSTVASKDLFLAFDVPRLFSTPPDDFDMVRDFTEKTLRNLTVRDVLHVIDLRSCDGSRSNWCPLGEGLMEAFMPLIIKFEGAVVLEFEDLQKALQSKRNLMHY